MDTKKIFAEVLKKIRKEKKLSQEDLALSAELDRTFISFMERGMKQPTLSSLLKLSKALGISASELVKKVEDEINK